MEREREIELSLRPPPPPLLSPPPALPLPPARPHHGRRVAGRVEGLHVLWMHGRLSLDPVEEAREDVDAPTLRRAAEEE
jgi:hypothetical protein